MKNDIIKLSILGAFAVILGAFGAHALKPYLNAYQLAIYHTASQYHFIFTLLYLGVILLSEHTQAPLTLIKRLILIGIILFSGSLYLLSTVEFHHLPSTVLGPLTPIGGILLALSFILLPFQFKK